MNKPGDQQLDDRGGDFEGPDFDDPDFDPDRLAECRYWRCGELFERRTSNQIYCRKACRSRQNKWERAQERRALRAAGKQAAGKRSAGSGSAGNQSR